MSAIVPLETVLGQEWSQADILRLTDRDIKPRLLVDPTLSEKQTLSLAINAIIRTMFKRRNTVRGVYNLADMRDFYIEHRVAGLGPAGREMLDTLFAVTSPKLQPASMIERQVAIHYHYPVLTASGIAYRAPLRGSTHGCDECPHFADCRSLVIERNGLALCEDILSAEVLIENYGGSNDIH